MRYIKVKNYGDEDPGELKSAAIGRGILAAVQASQKRGFFDALRRRLFPHDSPDFEHLYRDVVTWWLEIDDSGRPLREIGFDKDGKSIVFGPIGRNYGLWTGNCVVNFDSPNEPDVQNGFASSWDRISDAWKGGA